MVTIADPLAWAQLTWAATGRNVLVARQQGIAVSVL